MSDASGRDTDPLVQRVDALLKRNQESAGSPADDVPVLTEIVSPSANAASALALELERAVLARLEKELDGTLAALRTVLRDAVAAAVARELEARGYAARRPAPPEN
ncbi:MAG TPA: hypothetical protein VFR30_07670 [Lysobacter sp.]|nr:hypothetical protein [Lysobacter sp.]